MEEVTISHCYRRPAELESAKKVRFNEDYHPSVLLSCRPESQADLPFPPLPVLNPNRN